MIRSGKTSVVTNLLRFSLSLFLFLCFVVTVCAEWRTFGDFARIVETKPNGVVLETTARAKVLVEFSARNTIRVRYAPSGVFENRVSYAIDSSNERRAPLVKINQTKERIELTSDDGARIVVNKTPLAFDVFDASGALVVADDKTQTAQFNRETGEIKITKLRGGELETYYGFGEKALPFSRDSQVITNWNTDTYRYAVNQDPLYQSIPFFYAVRQGKSYGIFFNNTFRTFFDMGKSAPNRYSFGATGGELDYYVFTGGRDRAPGEVLTGYAALTGKMPLPPIWALGNQQSRFSYFPESRVREIAAEFRRRKIPIDAIYIDIDYMDGFRIFTWDKAKFPAPKQMISDLAKDGLKSILIINPAVKVDGNFPVYREAKTRNYFVKTADGKEFNGNVWAGKSAFLDFTDPRVREWFGALYKTNTDEGVAGFWNDMNEPSVFPDGETFSPPVNYSLQKSLPVDARHNGDGSPGDHARFHNVYGMQMARATFEGLRKIQPDKRPFVLSRAGFSGVQRFAAVWTGDNTASWEHLRLSLPMLLNMSVSGIPFVGADIGGYSDNPSPELFARWMQSAVFHPLFRPHAEKGTANKEPWEYGSEYEKINRRTVELRYEFLPYLYTLFREHERDGQPVVRPLWFEYAADRQTYLIDDEYLVGRDILVAPVVREGERKRRVYFPAGDDWRDWFSGEIYKGGTYAEIEAPLEKLPVFARVGAVIPTQSIVQHTGEMPSAPITLNVITGIVAEKIEISELFQDPGDGYDYRARGRREIKIEHRRGILRLNRSGDLKNPQKIKFIEALGIAQKPREMRVDGVIAEKVEFDAKRKRLRIEIGDAAKEMTLVR